MRGASHHAWCTKAAVRIWADNNEDTGSQGVIARPAASMSRRDLLEMQILGSHSRFPELKYLRTEPKKPRFKQPSRGFCCLLTSENHTTLELCCPPRLQGHHDTCWAPVRAHPVPGTVPRLYLPELNHFLTIIM